MSVDKEAPTNIIVNMKLSNKRFYDVAWSIALLQGYESLDEFVTDAFIDRVEMFPDGRDDFNNIHWGFKTSWEKEKELQEKKAKDIAIK